MKKIIICLFLSVGLSGCHIYRAYERPDEVVADSLYRQSVAAEDTVSLASLSWKELFTDPQLQQLIDIGIRNNTDLNIARLRVEEAEALLLSSKLASALCLPYSTRDNEQCGWYKNFQNL